MSALINQVFAKMRMDLKSMYHISGTILAPGMIAVVLKLQLAAHSSGCAMEMMIRRVNLCY